MLSVLVVDDERNQRETLADILRDEEYFVTTAENVNMALDLLMQECFDVVLTDFRMPGGSGMDVAKKALQVCPESAVLIMTAFADVHSVIEAMRIGVLDYMLKPLNVDSLLQKLSLLKERKFLRDKLSYARQELARHTVTTGLMGESLAMKQTREMVSQVASSMGSVLITGESGTGKEVTARMIHYMSQMDPERFLAINCGAIPENLLESELFGYKKGAFTGAVADKAGLFVSASGGTVFLDEIGEMPRSLQVKLLRVLQEKEVVPVGAVKPLKINVRIVAATNRDLKEEIKNGNFRQDLYYRINVIEINMPPLRDRLDDIPILANAFLTRFAKEMSRPARSFSNEVMRMFMNYSWPGNVRELENMVERAVILNGQKEVIEKACLPFDISYPQEPQKTMIIEEYELDAAMKSFSKKHICQILEVCHWDKKEASRLLGIGLSSLYRRIEELDIKQES